MGCAGRVALTNALRSPGADSGGVRKGSTHARRPAYFVAGICSTRFDFISTMHICGPHPGFRSIASSCTLGKLDSSANPGVRTPRTYCGQWPLSKDVYAQIPNSLLLGGRCYPAPRARTSSRRPAFLYPPPIIDQPGHFFPAVATECQTSVTPYAVSQSLRSLRVARASEPPGWGRLGP